MASWGQQAPSLHQQGIGIEVFDHVQGHYQVGTGLGQAGGGGVSQAQLRPGIALTGTIQKRLMGINANHLLEAHCQGIQMNASATAQVDGGAPGALQAVKQAGQ
jgi:hypothetical protein